MFSDTNHDNLFLELGYLDESHEISINQHINPLHNRQQHRQRIVDEYIDTLFSKYSKLMIVRVDLSYRDPIGRSKTLDEALDDFTHFRNCERKNPDTSNGRVGWIRLLEYGVEKGFHFHYIAFYDGQKHHKDVWKAKTIGQYWIDRTNGFGDYWNCNAEDYKQKSIGMVNRNDLWKIEHLKLVVVDYLTKVSQQPEQVTKRQLFRTGGIK